MDLLGGYNTVIGLKLYPYNEDDSSILSVQVNKKSVNCQFCLYMY